MSQSLKTKSYPKQLVSSIKDYQIRKSLVKYTTELDYNNAPFHRKWYEFLQPQNDPQHFSPLREHPLALKKFHLEAPRKHGKSECVSINYPSWLVGKYRNIHITIVSKTATLAEASLGAIVARIENNEGYKQVFGELKPRNPQKWTNQQIYVNRTETGKFPTIYATGLLGSLTGGGNDLIIADDIIDEENTINSFQIQKTSRWFHKVLLTTLFPWGAVLVIGTRWHHADLYSELLAKWPNQVLKAIKNPEEYSKGETAQVLWPEVWPIERLEDKREDIGTVYFDCQYQNDPTGMKGDILKAEMLHPWVHPPHANCLYYAGLDPSLGEHDYFGFATVAYDRAARQLYLVDVWAEHMPFPDILEHKIPLLNNQYHYSKMYMETNFWQKILISMPELRGLPIVPIQTVHSKEQRFIPMSSHFESKRVLVNPLLLRNSEFYNEWIQFPRGGHDDALDATELVVKNLVGVPKPAWTVR